MVLDLYVAFPEEDLMCSFNRASPPSALYASSAWKFPANQIPA